MTDSTLSATPPGAPGAATPAGTGLPVPTVLAPGAPAPSYAHPGDAGADLTTRVDVELGPGERATVPTGVSVALPDGYAAFVVPRSGLAARLGVTTLNAPGTVDAGYRGEIKVTLLNTDPRESVRLHAGERVAQLVVQRVERVDFRLVDALPGSVRGAGGHGSTGGARALGGATTATTTTAAANAAASGDASGDAGTTTPSDPSTDEEGRP